MCRADRVSNGLSERQIGELVAADDFAKSALNAPLNHFLTVHFEKNGLNGETVQQAQARLLERMSKYFNRRRSKLTAAWVVERGQVAGGLHTHILLHVPPSDARFDGLPKALARWLASPQTDVRSADKNLLAHSLDGVWQLKRRYGGPFGALNYLTKGRERIVGKRAGRTNNIGTTARQRHEWREAA